MIRWIIGAQNKKVEFSTSESQADAAPIVRPSVAPAKPKRVRDRRRRPAKIDRRSGVWLRILELKAIYESGLASDRVRTPLLEARIHEAAMLTALAEVGRARFLSGVGSDRLDAVMTAERVARDAVAKLRLADTEKRRPTSLADHFSQPVVRS
jgi:hypothetical protein